jgi:hypothetical protein
LLVYHLACCNALQPPADPFDKFGVYAQQGHRICRAELLEGADAGTKPGVPRQLLSLKIEPHFYIDIALNE